MQTFAQSETKCLNEDGNRVFDLGFVTSVREFDELNKEIEMTISVDIEDDETKEPFDARLRHYPNTGSRVLTVVQHPTDGNYHVDNELIEEPRITPIISFFLNPWPFEKYKIPMFLEFDVTAKLCFDEDDIHSYKGGFFPENPDWEVELLYSESSLEEMQQTIPKIKPRFDNSTIFKFETIIKHTENYFWKHVFYVIVPLVPILLIIGHGAFIRKQKLGTHIAFFTGVSILILTSLFAVAPSTPIDLTLLETISLFSIAAYAIGFFVFLYRVKIKDRHETKF